MESAALATQDVALTGWGFGVEGLSGTVIARMRARLAGDLVWPRSDDAFDLLLGYVELSRGSVRARVGRQESLSGLGFTAYDGADDFRRSQAAGFDFHLVKPVDPTRLQELLAARTGPGGGLPAERSA